MVVPILTAAFGVERLQKYGPRFDKQSIADWGSEQRLHNRQVTCRPVVRAREKSEATR
jgi:hypothetical protein